MKKDKLILLLTLFVLCIYPLQAKKVDVGSPNAINTRSSGTNGDVATFYVFSKGDDQGFIVISADDVAVPTLGVCSRCVCREY